MGISFGLNHIVAIVIILLLLFTSIWITNSYASSSDSKFKELIKKYFPFGYDDITSQEEFLKYFNKEYKPKIENCKESKKAGCWCTKDKFNIPSENFIAISEKGNNMINFRFLNKDKLEYGSNSIKDIGACVILEQGDFDLEEEILVSNEDNLYINYKEFKNKANPSLFLYKLNSGNICIVDESSISKLEDSSC